jgi:hypothetical protein
MSLAIPIFVEGENDPFFGLAYFVTTSTIQIDDIYQYLRHLISRNKMNSEMHHTEFNVQRFLISELFK